MASILKPLLTEKMTRLADRQQKVGFICDRKADKNEIKSEIEKLYQVEVDSINTIVTSRKPKRNRRTGQVTGKTNIYKKAIVKLKEGFTINFYENI